MNITTSKTLVAKLTNILVAFIVVFIWVLFVNHLLKWLYPPPPAPPEADPFFVEDIPPFRYEFFMACILAPLWEELAYRQAPGLLAKALGEKFLLPIMIISSAVFGWGHGHGPESILKQGAMGFVFFYVYVKNGYSYWSSVVVHAGWNILIVLS